MEQCPEAIIRPKDMKGSWRKDLKRIMESSEDWPTATTWDRDVAQNAGLTTGPLPGFLRIFFSMRTLLDSVTPVKLRPVVLTDRGQAPVVSCAVKQPATLDMLQDTEYSGWRPLDIATGPVGEDWISSRPRSVLCLLKHTAKHSNSMNLKLSTGEFVYMNDEMIKDRLGDLQHHRETRGEVRDWRSELERIVQHQESDVETSWLNCRTILAAIRV